MNSDLCITHNGIGAPPHPGEVTRATYHPDLFRRDDYANRFCRPLSGKSCIIWNTHARSTLYGIVMVRTSLFPRLACVVACVRKLQRNPTMRPLAGKPTRRDAVEGSENKHCGRSSAESCARDAKCAHVPETCVPDLAATHMPRVSACVTSELRPWQIRAVVVVVELDDASLSTLGVNGTRCC